MDSFFTIVLMDVPYMCAIHKCRKVFDSGELGLGLGYFRPEGDH